MSQSATVQHPDTDTLRRLDQGRLPFKETAELNRHIRSCEKCRDTFAAVVDNCEEQSPPPELHQLYLDLFQRSRRIAAEELTVTVPESLNMVPTGLDRIFKSLEHAGAERFLVTPGKLETLLEEIKRQIRKLDKNAQLTPEGEKSFMTFLAKCVEENTIHLSRGRDEVELGLFMDVFESLKDTASGRGIGLEESDILIDAEQAFEEKVSNMLGALRERAGGA